MVRFGNTHCTRCTQSQAALHKTYAAVWERAWGLIDQLHQLDPVHWKPLRGPLRITRRD